MLTNLINTFNYYVTYAGLILILVFAIGLIVSSLTAGGSGRYVSNVFHGLGRVFTALLRGLWNGFISFLLFYGRTFRRSYRYLLTHLPIRVEILRWLATLAIIAIVHALIGFGLYQLWVVLI